MAMAISNVINLSGLDVTSTGKVLIKTVFQRNVILLNDVTTLLGLGVPLPLPIIGFEYDPIQRIELLKYSYPRTPLINRATTTNAYIKETIKFTISATKTITAFNTFLLNFGVNQAIVSLLDTYCTKGGTFTIITPWSVITNCVLLSLEGVNIGEGDAGGQGFVFNFEKLNIYEDTEGTLNSFMQSLTSGGAV